jgi:hypothetical protein
MLWRAIVQQQRLRHAAADALQALPNYIRQLGAQLQRPASHSPQQAAAAAQQAKLQLQDRRKQQQRQLLLKVLQQTAAAGDLGFHGSQFSALTPHPAVLHSLRYPWPGFAAALLAESYAQMCQSCHCWFWRCCLCWQLLCLSVENSAQGSLV